MGTAVFFNIKELGAVKAEKNEIIVCRYGTSWYNNIEYRIYHYLSIFKEGDGYQYDYREKGKQY